MECAVYGCPNYYRKTIGKNIAYHSFPRNPVYRQKWIDFCNKVYVAPKSSAKICSVHFTSSCYKRDLEHELLGLPPRKRKFLNDDAVPTLTSNTENPKDESPKVAKKLRELKPKPRPKSTPKISNSKKIKLEKEILKKPRTKCSTPEEPNITNTPSPIAETSIEPEMTPQPEEVTTGIKIKVENDDGSYDVNEGTDSGDKNIIPSTLCDVVLKSVESTEQSLNRTVELGQTTKSKEYVTFSSPPISERIGDGPIVMPEERIIFRSLRPPSSNTPLFVVGPTNEFSTVQTTKMKVTTIGTITVPAPNLMTNNIPPAVPSPVIVAEHPVETFFRSMAKTVLTFPPHLVAEARMKVCSAVTELELRAIKENDSSKESAT